MRIEVTQEDIKLGKPRTGSSCPVYLAILRLTGIRRPILADEMRLLPREVSSFIHSFDNDDRPFYPFSFELPTGWGVPVRNPGGCPAYRGI